MNEITVEDNQKEAKEVEIEGKIKLITNTRDNSIQNIELNTKVEENVQKVPHQSTLDEPIKDTLVIFLSFSVKSIPLV